MIAPRTLDPDVVRALERHETEAHAIGGRDLVELPDAIGLFDPGDADPFWNRITSIRWPADPVAFDRRLAQAMTLFAIRERRPHVWPSALGDEPADLVDRLRANGFEDTGRGILMARAELEAVSLPSLDPRITLQIIRDATEPSPVRDAALVLASSFVGHGESDPAFGEGDAGHGEGRAHEQGTAVEIEATAAAAAADLDRVLRDDRVTLVLARVDAEPAAIAKVTGGSGFAYLSSIGTRPAFRGRGLAGIVTGAALLEGARTGAGLAYLGVFEGNHTARRLYARLGFEIVGAPVPDLLLVE